MEAQDTSQHGGLIAHAVRELLVVSDREAPGHELEAQVHAFDWRCDGAAARAAGGFGAGVARAVATAKVEEAPRALGAERRSQRRIWHRHGGRHGVRGAMADDARVRIDRVCAKEVQQFSELARDATKVLEVRRVVVVLLQHLLVANDVLVVEDVVALLAVLDNVLEEDRAPRARVARLTKVVQQRQPLTEVELHTSLHLTRQRAIAPPHGRHAAGRVDHVTHGIEQLEDVLERLGELGFAQAQDGVR